MKRLLILLLISIVACAIIEEIEAIEEPNEYDDDVSLEINVPRIMKSVKRAASSGPAKKIIKPVQKFVKREGKKVKKVLKPVVKPIQKFVKREGKKVKKALKPVVKPIQKFADKQKRNFRRFVGPGGKNLRMRFFNNVIKPSVNRAKSIERRVHKPLKKFLEPATKRVNKFLQAHPTLKKIVDPIYKELKKTAKDPNKILEQIFQDPKNLPKMIKKSAKPIIEQIKKSGVIKKITGPFKKVEDFLEKHHIPIKEAQKMFKDKALKAYNQLSKNVQNGIYWLKQKGYWEPLVLVGETLGEMAATSLCSMALTPAVCEPVVGFAFTFVINPYIDSI